MLALMDETAWAGENELPNEFLDEEVMPSQPERIAALETGMKIVCGFFVVLIPSLLGWGWNVSTNLTAIKQQLADGGNTKIVTELRNPSSPEKLQATLATVSAQIQSARADSVKPSPAKIVRISSAVADLVGEHPQVAEGWQVASQLINYRSNEVPSGQSRDCYKQADKGSSPELPSTNTLQIASLFFNDCTVNLDDIEGLNHSPVYLDARRSALYHPEYR